MKTDVSRIRGPPDDMLEEIGKLILEKKVCCEVLQDGMTTLVTRRFVPTPAIAGVV